MWWSNYARTVQLLSLCPAARETTTVRSPCTITREEPRSSQLQKSPNSCVRVLSHSVVSDPCNPITIACQAPLSTGFSKQEYWSGQSFPPPGDLPNLGIEPTSLTSPALAGRFFPTSTTWEALNQCYQG